MMKEYLLFWSIPCATVVAICAVCLWRLEIGASRIVAAQKDALAELGSIFTNHVGLMKEMDSRANEVLIRALVKTMAESVTESAKACRESTDELMRLHREQFGESSKQFLSAIRSDTSQHEQTRQAVNKHLRHLSKLLDIRTLLAKGAPRPGGVHV